MSANYQNKKFSCYYDGRIRVVIKGSSSCYEYNIDGTRYNLNEVGSYQVNTSSGSYTLGMYSGKASSCMSTLKDIFLDISRLVVPEDEAVDDVKKKIVFV